MKLDVIPGKPDEIEFAWSLYGPFIEEKIFKSGLAGAKSYDSRKERARFEESWSRGSHYIIAVDGKPIGWSATRHKDDALVIDNMLLVGEWQQKGVGERVFTEMTGEWKASSQTVLVPLLKNGDGVGMIEESLVNLGFALSHEDELTRVMRSTWA